MSYYICKTKPEFKDWQFKKASESISKEEFSNLKTLLKNLIPEENDRYNLYSTQNEEYSMHLWHSERYDYSITVTSFPERHKEEFIKYIHQICSTLKSKLYSLGNDGESAIEFDFSKHKGSIEKEYKPLNEKQYSKLEINELIGLLTLSTTKDKVIEYLNLNYNNKDTWENSINDCYNSDSIVIRQIDDWAVVIVKPENLVNASSAGEQNKLMIKLLKELSQAFGKVGYSFNASKYGYFENYQFMNGEIKYKYIHGDGEEEIDGVKSKEYFEDFLSCLLYTSPSPRDKRQSRMPSSA